jgi:23S rRNA (uracil747-C5)-methyltransferase
MDQDPHELLTKKKLILKNIFNLEPEETIQGSTWGFRDKIKLIVGGTLESPLIGLLSLDLKSVTELPLCPVQATALNDSILPLKDFITRWKLVPYDINLRKGELKGIILSWSPTTKQKMIRFTLRSKEALDRVRQGIQELSEFNVISVNIQPIPHAILEGDEEIILSPTQSLIHQSGNIRLSFSPQSFMQTNSSVATQLYLAATEWLSPWKSDRVLDLFCGVGGFSLHLANQGHEVLGIEVNASAIKEAQRMAREQNLSAQFKAAPVADIEHEWISFDPNIVVVNPPRRGLGAGLALIMKQKPEFLLYSSCSHESLATDFSELKMHYDARRTKLFDMFPFTHHFESLTLLVRR